MSISVVQGSWVKCSEVLQFSDVLLVLSFIWLYVLYTSVSFSNLCILTVMFIYYCYECAVVQLP